MLFKLNIKALKSVILKLLKTTFLQYVWYRFESCQCMQEPKLDFKNPENKLFTSHTAIHLIV